MTGTETELGIEGFREMMMEYFEAFPGSVQEIHDLVAEDDTVIVRFTYSCVHEGEFLGIEPTGNHIATEEYITFHIEDGEIAELHPLVDELARLRQLGVELPV